MPEIFINGQPVQAAAGQTVMQVARDHGFFIPYFCWHPNLSVSGNCRICVVEVEGRGLDIACNLPVSDGLHVLTDSEAVLKQRKSTMQFITLNHPVDCGICDKAGECSLQDYHVLYNGEASISVDAKVRATKFVELSDRVVLDNERCILCSRCVRFVAEVSGSHSLGIQHRGDESLLRPSEDGAFASDHYSENVVDICPVGALLSRSFLHKARVWYLKSTPSVCPGCERGCSIDVWHRKGEWKLHALDPRENTAIARVTPRENPAVNGPWVCNKARDLAKIIGRPRATQAMLEGRPAGLAEAIAAARALIAQASRPMALVSSWGSNEELAACAKALGNRFSCHVKRDHEAQPGEPLQDDLLVRADKNPNTAGARALFGDAPAALDDAADLVLVWGEGCNFATLPKGARIVFLNAFLAPENGHADVFLPISVQTERSGHYTNFQGVASRFEQCFAPAPGVAHAQAVFEALAGSGGGAS
jgi:NADH-quinone oxidoreductase subunit G